MGANGEWEAFEGGVIKPRFTEQCTSLRWMRKEGGEVLLVKGKGRINLREKAVGGGREHERDREKREKGGN